MSETYRALTRKYRPTSFDDIVSQEHVSNTIKNAIKQNRLSHAYMFCGPRGVGKTTMARVLARTINEIDTSVDGESLNQTLNIVEMDAASNNKVDDVHHLRESVRIPPQNGKYKVFIVDEVHMLSKAAFNALLKTLEEPPEHAIFIFATTEPHKVLPTILSRVQRFDFKRISVNEIVQRLRKISLDEDISIDDESLHVIAKKADGALRDALGLMDQAIAFCGDTITHDELLQALNVVGSERLFQFMECVKNHDADAGLSLIDTLLQEGYDIQEYLIGLTEHLRNLYIAHETEQLYLVEESEETKKRYQQTAKHFSRDDLMRMLHIISEAQIKLKDASQPRIQFEITLLKLIHMERSEKLSELLAGLEELKKNSGNFVSPSENGSSQEKTTAEAKAEQNANGQDASEAEEPKQVQATPERNGQQASVDQEPAPESEPELQHEAKADNSAEEEPSETNSVEESSDEQYEEEFEVEEPDYEEPAMEPEPEEDEDDEFDIGAPAIVTNLSKKAGVAVKPSRPKREAAAAASFPQKEEKPAPEKITAEYVQEQWVNYVNSLEDEFPKLLQMQVERVKVLKLKGKDLYLECESQFSHKILEEQKTDLQKKLKECVGTLLRFNISVAKQSEKDKPMSVYERFKQIQQKDPIIKDIVDIFGAELEY
ncbi:DNA polymerase III subunit gamma/tau [Gracilimonas mengyeensis]|uniref:DNA polymerase III subunit gamma/tau n=1 Tax=Gracilimonas mengyeensis TaxID=1302730 RepID=A0A521BV64_9BACT|nr:DNA polymerase III subunit gamma/tau [Gracilimonas mengyeensis]SMO51084.1 DNA polymerase-3 subunit gamma/tau [Gracilimonas mengyeensis]